MVPNFRMYSQGRFLKLAVAWTTARGQRLRDDSGLCGLVGRCLWNEGELERGTRYHVLGERPQELCDLILQDVSDANARKLAVGKGVLQFARKRSLRDANALLAANKMRAEIKNQHPKLVVGGITLAVALPSALAGRRTFFRNGARALVLSPLPYVVYGGAWMKRRGATTAVMC
ncbi:conserved unknown protein [Ectocarpus siliculosus]|uniref:Uncharacterized protein n=1 Tax=Ectocarpus siliculosus TaxID=2880 RepID=D7G1P9_ECTSI|nr:conserved unknown protein [Ectocarpus siliculosus]|eukprot:CBJ33294.1 conserved unknown protein [Ectocarpus siliculosus]